MPALHSLESVLARVGKPARYTGGEFNSVIRDWDACDVRIALGGVAHKPWRARDSEAALQGEEPGSEAFEAAARASVSGARPYRDNAFKIDLAQRAVARALGLAAARA